MNVKTYNFKKNPQKTATINNLIFVDGNVMTDKKLLFDFSFLETLGISKDEIDAIKKDAMANCSIANRTAFVFYNADDWTACNAIVDFNVHRVFSSKTWELLYVVLEAKRIKYSHTERISKYDKFYTKNVNEFEADSLTISPINDFEI